MKSNLISRFAAVAIVAVAALCGSLAHSQAASLLSTRVVNQKASPANPVRSGQLVKFTAQVQYKDSKGVWRLLTNSSVGVEFRVFKQPHKVVPLAKDGSVTYSTRVYGTGKPGTTDSCFCGIIVQKDKVFNGSSASVLVVIKN
jgi:hypothetical protein